MCKSIKIKFISETLLYYYKARDIITLFQTMIPKTYFKEIRIEIVRIQIIKYSQEIPISWKREKLFCSRVARWRNYLTFLENYRDRRNRSKKKKQQSNAISIPTGANFPRFLDAKNSINFPPLIALKKEIKGRKSSRISSFDFEEKKKKNLENLYPFRYSFSSSNNLYSLFLPSLDFISPGFQDSITGDHLCFFPPLNGLTPLVSLFIISSFLSFEFISRIFSLSLSSSSLDRYPPRLFGGYISIDDIEVRLTP